MSYHVYVFRKEVKEAEQQSGDRNFWDNEANIQPFDDAQKQYLHDRLLGHGFEVNNKEAGDYRWKSRHSISATLTDRGLYFTGGFTQNDISEIGMTASGFTDTGEFAKYDPQNAQWNDGL